LKRDSGLSMGIKSQEPERAWLIDCCQEVVISASESGPVPSTLEALSKAAHARVLGALDWCRSLDRDSGGSGASTRALAVGAARAKMLPLAERAVAAIACTMQLALGMEACELV
jgi:hypothetical protein